MKINKLTVGIVPHYYSPEMKELHVEVVVDGIEKMYKLPFHTNDFESHFETMLDRAKYEVIRSIKASKK